MTYILCGIGLLVVCAILGISPAEVWDTLVTLWHNTMLGYVAIFIIILFVGGAAVDNIGSKRTK